MVSGQVYRLVISSYLTISESELGAGLNIIHRTSRQPAIDEDLKLMD
jgi:hypothetical protein